MNDIYKLKTSPMCNNNSIVQGEKYRFTVLTSQMIRLEYNPRGIFEDRATQTVIDRDFDVPEFRVIDKDDSLEIVTDNISLIYNKKEFSKSGLNIKVKGNLTAYNSVWSYGDETYDLRGTSRTLDGADGEIALERGLLSKNGFSIIDDSKSLILNKDGWVEVRENDVIDIYFLGYGRDYITCLKDFFKLCGSTPMLPRYALGNWWSRYYKYTEKEYKELIERFERENIPFSVSVIDMDWHLVDIDTKYGSGWTGYTWNKELFSNPKAFMEWLHNKGLKVTLNVHPADGVKGHEEMYIEMAKELEVNYNNEDEIHFDITDQKFLDAYFKYLHHPNEENGVDFWWIDWQQGNNTRIEGLDPLWMLNHYHFLDNQRNGKRPLTFSRYAGVGSHRYPVGFSGDTIITWESLDFQPYFTANASNIGYGWWSHDIGGHMLGVKDDEMAARWLQFGVFSPIMRLHSSSSIFNSKEPWRYNKIINDTMKDYLRLRHGLIPYLYTMNKKFNEEGVPLIQPMYYHNSNKEEAYKVRNQYYFGTELIVCPITKPMNNKLNVAKVKAWLPEGKYIDMMNGMIYDGNRYIDFYRDITEIPVIAKAGAIIPMENTSNIGNGAENPDNMEIKIFAGDNGTFTLYEDDGNTLEYTNGKYAETKFSLEWNDSDSVKFTIDSAKGDCSVIPEKRDYTLKFIGFTDCDNISITSKDDNINFTKEYNEFTNTITIVLNNCKISEIVNVKFNGKIKIAENNIIERSFEFLNKAQIGFDLKEELFGIIKLYKNPAKIVAVLQTLGLDEDLFGALCELILAL